MRDAEKHILIKYACALLQSVSSQDWDITITHLKSCLNALKEKCAPYPLQRCLKELSLQRQVGALLLKETTLWPSVRSLIALLVHYGRLNFLENLVEIFEDHVRRQRGFPSVRLSVCHEAGPQEQKMLHRLFGVNAHVVTEKNPRIQGGYMMEVNGFLIDRSVRTYLKQFQKHWEEWLNEHQPT